VLIAGPTSRVEQKVVTRPYSNAAAKCFSWLPKFLWRRHKKSFRNLKKLVARV